MLNLATLFAPDTFPTLETERCILRRYTDNDAEDILRVMGDPEVMRYIGKPLASLDDAHQRLLRYQNAFRDQTGFMWAITNRANGEYMGNGLLFNLASDHFRAEIGYALAPKWWGQQFMSEIMPALLEFAFMTMGLHSLEAKIDPNNAGSRRLLEKFGFVQEAHFRENFYQPATQTFGDTAILSLLKSAWQPG